MSAEAPPRIQNPAVAGDAAAAVAAFAAGEPVVVVTGTGGWRTAAVAVIADPARATAATVALLRRHAGGAPCVALAPERAAALRLDRRDRGTAPGAPSRRATFDAADARDGGLTAGEQARAIRLAADPAAPVQALVSPGHVQALVAARGGLRDRLGDAEAAVDLSRLAGRGGAVLLVRAENADGAALDAEDAHALAQGLGAALATAEQLLAHRQLAEPLVERVTAARLPTAFGTFDAIGYRSLRDGGEHVALVQGDLAGNPSAPVHVHPRCLVGDLLGAPRCDCRTRLDAALTAVAAAGRGVVLYCAPPQGEEAGGSERTRRAVLECGAQTAARDGRHRATAAAILADLGLPAPSTAPDAADVRTTMEKSMRRPLSDR